MNVKREPFGTYIQPELRERLEAAITRNKTSKVNAVEAALEKWLGQEDSSPLASLSKEERYLAIGFILGHRAKDPVVALAVEALKPRIQEKGYEYKEEAAGERKEHPRRKVAG